MVFEKSTSIVAPLIVTFAFFFHPFFGILFQIHGWGASISYLIINLRLSPPSPLFTFLLLLLFFFSLI